jgi:hypothetical protein
MTETKFSCRPMIAEELEMDDTPAADMVATLDGAAVIVFSIDVTDVGVSGYYNQHCQNRCSHLQ